MFATYLRRSAGRRRAGLSCSAAARACAGRRPDLKPPFAPVLSRRLRRDLGVRAGASRPDLWGIDRAAHLRLRSSPSRFAEHSRRCHRFERADLHPRCAHARRRRRLRRADAGEGRRPPSSIRASGRPPTSLLGVDPRRRRARRACSGHGARSRSASARASSSSASSWWCSSPARSSRSSRRSASCFR